MSSARRGRAATPARSAMALRRAWRRRATRSGRPRASPGRRARPRAAPRSAGPAAWRLGVAPTADLRREAQPIGVRVECLADEVVDDVAAVVLGGVDVVDADLDRPAEHGERRVRSPGGPKTPGPASCIAPNPMRPRGRPPSMDVVVMVMRPPCGGEQWRAQHARPLPRGARAPHRRPRLQPLIEALDTASPDFRAWRPRHDRSKRCFSSRAPSCFRASTTSSATTAGATRRLRPEAPGSELASRSSWTRRAVSQAGSAGRPGRPRAGAGRPPGRRPGSSRCRRPCGRPRRS
jgi:hypothetical protein